MTTFVDPTFRRILFAVLIAKLLLAAWVPPFGDEVFYWQEGWHPAIAYSDLPPLTAWLARAGTALFGHHVFGLRFAFVLCGFAALVVLLAFAQRRGMSIEAVGRYALALPLFVLVGQLATPDAPLTLAFVVAAYALDRALDDHSWRFWIVFGVALALAWMTHWRAAMLYPAGLLLLMLSPRAQAAVRLPKFWIAQAIGLLGLVPVLWFNLDHDWVGLRFQAVDRHAWTFQAMSLLQPIEQALTMGVLLYPILLWAMWRAWHRRKEAGFDVIAAMSLAIAGGYFLAGLFADAERTRFHWPLPAYLPLLLVLPQWSTSSLRTRYAQWARITGILTTFGIVAMLVSLRLANASWPPGGESRVAEPFLGWSEAAATTRSHLTKLPADTVLVADNFLSAAQLDFALGGARAVYVLDHPRNIKHGRQAQLAIWQRDQAALEAIASSRSLLLVEENALYGADTLPFYRRLCRSFDSVRFLDALSLYGDGRRFVWMLLERDGENDCRIPPLGRLDAPVGSVRLRQGEGFVLSGYVFREPDGIDAFEVRIDGRPDPDLSESYGTPAAFVRKVWPDLVDRNWPNVGFYRGDVGRELTRGTHHIEIRARVDGHWRRIGGRVVVVE